MNFLDEDASCHFFGVGERPGPDQDSAFRNVDQGRRGGPTWPLQGQCENQEVELVSGRITNAKRRHAGLSLQGSAALGKKKLGGKDVEFVTIPEQATCRRNEKRS